ncbi:MAG: nucleotidyltransferase domain-containing protein [Clostridiaceae bacterium]
MKEEIIYRFIHHMIKKYKVSSTMLVGSYINGMIEPHSDIDVYMLWNNKDKYMKGREIFEGKIFEYYIAPESKYLKDIEESKVAARIYSSSVIFYDPKSKFQNIRELSIKRLEKNEIENNHYKMVEYKIFIEEIKDDGERLHSFGYFEDFLYFTTTNIEKIVELVVDIKVGVPIFNRYGISELKNLDFKLGSLIDRFLKTGYSRKEKRELWKEICEYVSDLIGEYNTKEYCREIRLE